MANKNRAFGKPPRRNSYRYSLQNKSRRELLGTVFVTPQNIEIVKQSINIPAQVKEAIAQGGRVHIVKLKPILGRGSYKKYRYKIVVNGKVYLCDGERPLRP